VENYLSEATGMKLKLFFDQYLRNTKIPVFEYSVIGKVLAYRWKDCVAGFDMPLKIKINNKDKWVYPLGELTQIQVDENSSVTVDPAFYIIPAEIKQ
jgi:aminopeptidase N